MPIPVGAGVVLELEARSTAYRGLADALIVTGDETGAATSGEDLRRARAAVPDRPILIGSGLNIGNVSELLPLCDGAILGTALKVDGVTEGPVDRLRVREMVARRAAVAIDVPDSASRSASSGASILSVTVRNAPCK